MLSTHYPKKLALLHTYHLNTEHVWYSDFHYIRIAYSQTLANTSNRFFVRLKFADLSIIPVWTYDELTQSIRFDVDSNTYIFGEYILFNIRCVICFEVECFYREPSFFCFVYFST